MGCVTRLVPPLLDLVVFVVDDFFFLVDDVCFCCRFDGVEDLGVVFFFVVVVEFFLFGFVVVEFFVPGCVGGRPLDGRPLVDASNRVLRRCLLGVSMVNL